MKSYLLCIALTLTPRICTMNNECPQNDLQNKFLRAVKKNDDITVDEFLDNETLTVDLNYKDKRGNTALHIACRKGSQYIAASLILQDNINLNTKNNRDQSPLDCLNHVIDRNKIKKRHTKPWRNIRKTLKNIYKLEYLTNNVFECPICYETNEDKNFLLPATQFCLHMLCKNCQGQCDQCPFCKRIKLPQHNSESG